MTGEDQSRAYAEADFSEPHTMFIETLSVRIPQKVCQGTVLDLGCGSADISLRFARQFQHCQIDAVDGSAAMLKHAGTDIQQENLSARIQLLEQCLPDLDLPHDDYDLIISNSLLHHLHDPSALWSCINNYTNAGSYIFIMDLMRPDSTENARKMVTQYAANEPDILQHDFYHSLLAAFTPREVNQQLKQHKLGHLRVEILSDRHLCVHGSSSQV